MKQQQTPRGRGLVEIWGDTADTGHLAWSIVIGAVVSLAGFLLASRLLVGIAGSPDLARAYAMLAGLGGCLVAGAICARLFPPKREVVEGRSGQPGNADDIAWREQALDKLAEEAGGLGKLADLPPAVVAELKELQLYELFAARERGGMASATVARPGAQDAGDALPGVHSNAA
jgi:hypothetical protein